MNKIEKLISELCPDGVEYKDLGEVILLKKGKQLNKNLLSEIGLYPAYNGWISYSGFTDTYNYNENTIIISQGWASAGFVNFLTTKFYANAHCYVVLPNIEIINNRFVYHFLKLHQEKLTQKQHGAGIPALKTSEILKLKIPIPDIKIQKEIVKILDNFTMLEAELEAELEARKKQYEYYRSEMLSFGDKIEFKELKKVCQITNNNRRPIRADLRIPWNTPYYGANNIQDNVEGFTHDGSYVLIAEDGSADLKNYSIQFTSGKFWANNHVHVIVGLGDLNTRFLFYYLKSMNFIPFLTWLPRAKLTRGNLEQIKIPILKSNKQEEIVKVLDKFDKLVNNISEGLPAEIEARRQQYEYYREKLLTFKELK
jgi:type I restriction enzyme, S subunit